MTEPAIGPGDDQELAAIQGHVAGVPEHAPGGLIEFMGRKFRVADKIGLMPLLKFSDAAELNTEDPRALSAMYAMLRDSIYAGSPACGDAETCKACEAGDETSCPAYDKGDWLDFERHAIDTKAEAEDLLDVVTKVIELVMGRPTEPPARSSAGRRSIAGGSTGRSSNRRGGGSRR